MVYLIEAEWRIYAKLATIASENSLLSVRRQAIIWTNSDLLSIRRPTRNNIQWNFQPNSNIFIQEKNLKISFAKWQQFCTILNVFSFESDKIKHLSLISPCCKRPIYSNLGYLYVILEKWNSLVNIDLSPPCIHSIACWKITLILLVNAWYIEIKCRDTISTSLWTTFWNSFSSINSVLYIEVAIIVIITIICITSLNTINSAAIIIGILSLLILCNTYRSHLIRT